MGCVCDQIAGRERGELSPICIGHLWIFENLKPEELEALTKAARRRIFHRGEEVFSQGQPAHRMFLLKTGRVKLSKVTEEGDEITLDLRKSGDFLGESMLLEDKVYPLTATCLEDTLICGFDKPGFEQLILQYPNIGLQVIKNLSRRIDWLTSRVGGLSFTHLEDRLYHMLAQVAREHGIPHIKGHAIQFPLTHEELGFLVGAHRVSITRAMKTLRKSGKIIQEGRTLILTEP
jgi:CRP/FNR family transcriptional regulator|uniref:Crp/Fnr family transcriptional regulator n=1 Tax=Desulfobacca acetoxidans TaxID=60893 RepID=A0A7C3SIH9_9BACT